jgi:hypothetical protein
MKRDKELARITMIIRVLQAVIIISIIMSLVSMAMIIITPVIR